MQEDSFQPAIHSNSLYPSPQLDYQFFPLNLIQKEGLSNTPVSQQNSIKKGKGLTKLPKKETKKKKRIKDNTIRTQMGRPKNEKIQKDHLEQSKTFNDILYHSSKMLLLLMLKKENKALTPDLQLQNYQIIWMSQTRQIMSIYNFPTYQQEKSIYHLHPNSLHFVFYYRQIKEGRSEYYQQQVKYMFFAFLEKNKILNPTVFDYVNNYWQDIVYQVNNPDGDEQDESQREDQIQFRGNISSERIANNENINGENINQKSLESKNCQPKRRTKEQNFELQVLRKQLKNDDSIAAYQIACYLYACCVKYQIKIMTNF